MTIQKGDIMLSIIKKQIKDSITPMIDEIIVSLMMGGENELASELTNYQESLESIGNVLEEEYHISPESPVIRMLEESCELLYEWFEKSRDISEIRKKLTDALKSFGEKLDESVDTRDDRVSVVAIMRDEGRYLDEFICYHLLIGVSHFYFYDNESKDNTEEVLEPYIRAGVVTLLDAPGDCMQLPAYNDAIKQFKYDTQYMAFIDLDEFIVPTNYGDKIGDIMDDIAKVHYSQDKQFVLKRIGGVTINWVVYGTSHHKESVDGLVTENYLYHADMKSVSNHTVKLILDPRVTEGFKRTPHTVKYISDEYTSVSERDSYIDSMLPFFRDASYDRFRLNHYSTKSESEYLYKLCKRGWPDQEHKQIDPNDEVIREKIRQANEDWNAEYDDCMLKYVEDIREKIREFRGTKG